MANKDERKSDYVARSTRKQ